MSFKSERALGMRNIERIKGIRHELYTVEAAAAATEVSHVDAKKQRRRSRFRSELWEC